MTDLQGAEGIVASLKGLTATRALGQARGGRCGWFLGRFRGRVGWFRAISINLFADENREPPMWNKENLFVAILTLVVGPREKPVPEGAAGHNHTDTVLITEIDAGIKNIPPFNINH